MGSKQTDRQRQYNDKTHEKRKEKKKKHVQLHLNCLLLDE